jgi:transcription elongation factor Elf1
MNKFNCPNCSQPVAIEAVLRGVKGYDRRTNSSVALCPLCDKGIEFQVRANVLVVGYVYSSGSPHFEGLFDVPATGIRCQADEHGVACVYKGERYEVPE